MLGRSISVIANVFLLFVFLVYTFIGWCGLRRDSISVSRVLPSFMVANPYPLLHTVNACVSRECGPRALDYEFAGPLIEDPEWKALSVAVVAIGLLGFSVTVAAIRGIRASLGFLGIIVAFTLLVAFWNTFAFVINTRKVGGSAAGSFWYPLYSIGWTISYVLGYLGMRTKTTPDAKGF